MRADELVETQWWSNLRIGHLKRFHPEVADHRIAGDLDAAVEVLPHHARCGCAALGLGHQASELDGSGCAGEDVALARGGCGVAGVVEPVPAGPQVHDATRGTKLPVGIEARDAYGCALDVHPDRPRIARRALRPGGPGFSRDAWSSDRPGDAHRIGPRTERTVGVGCARTFPDVIPRLRGGCGSGPAAGGGECQGGVGRVLVLDRGSVEHVRYGDLSDACCHEALPSRRCTRRWTSHPRPKSRPRLSFPSSMRSHRRSCARFRPC